MDCLHNAKLIEGMQEGTYNLHSFLDSTQFSSLFAKKFIGENIVLGIPKSTTGYKGEVKKKIFKK